MVSHDWLPLAEYSSKYKVSISTLRRRIKAEDIQFRFDEGKYFIADQPLAAHARESRPSRMSDPNMGSLSSRKKAKEGKLHADPQANEPKANQEKPLQSQAVPSVQETASQLQADIADDRFDYQAHTDYSPGEAYNNPAALHSGLSLEDQEILDLLSQDPSGPRDPQPTIESSQISEPLEAAPTEQFTQPHLEPMTEPPAEKAPVVNYSKPVESKENPYRNFSARESQVKPEQKIEFRSRSSALRGGISQQASSSYYSNDESEYDEATEQGFHHDDRILHGQNLNEDQEAILSAANQLLGELKRAYTQILQEKEEQILRLNEEISDLKTLVQVLEEDRGLKSSPSNDSFEDYDSYN